MLLASSAFAPFACAADLPTWQPAPSAFTWTGVYAGVQGGYAASLAHLVELQTATGISTGSINNFAPDGFTGGGHVGANLQWDALVVSVVADVEGATMRGTFRDATGLGRGNESTNLQGSVRGRLGYAIGNMLVYATGGYAFANIKDTYVFIPTGTAESFSGLRSGWTAGGGVDYALTPNWIISAEYRFTEFGRFDNLSTLAFPGLTGQTDTRSNVGRVAISYKF